VGCALAFVAAPAPAVDLPLPGVEAATLHGYYKNFFLAVDASEEALSDGVEDLNRARLMLDGRLNARIGFAVHYEQFATVHPLGAGTAFFLGEPPAVRPGLVDLTWTITSGKNLDWQHEIDRLSVDVRSPWGDVILGRQAIGWGVGLIWAPEDLFIAFSPVQIDREFRTGVDAARVLVPLGPFTEAEAVYAAFDSGFDQQATALRWRTTLEPSNVDVGVMGGKFYDDVVLGSLFAGQVRGIGVHGEATYTHNYGGDVGPKNFVRAVLGADYRFPKDVRVVGEYYLNGFGATNPDRYLARAASPRFARGEIFNVGRQYVGFVADWEAHPLLHLIAQGQANLLDPSALLGPAFALSLSDEAALEAGAYFGLGEGLAASGVPHSEFGPAPNVYYVAAKIYF
jgi:hypothetical protein